MNKINKIKNGYAYDLNGWRYISIQGSPKERGYAYGYLCADIFKGVPKMLAFQTMEIYGETWDYMVKNINKFIKEKTIKDFNEWYEEMVGITEGMVAAGTETTIDEIIAWNFYNSLPYWYGFLKSIDTAHTSLIHKEGGAIDKCSAFIACGEYTKDGKIVVAHNTFDEYVSGQYLKIVLDIHPDNGNRIIMQTSPGWIYSGSDFFITSKGIIGTETTIGGFSGYENLIPVAYRARKAMQYGNSLDEYVKIFLDGNSGDYANSWLFGDINTNEILRLELGLKYHNVEKTKNGYFIGFNAAYDERIRNKECVNNGFYDIRRHQGSRRVRLTELMEENKGKIDIEIAKKIIADHYDVYLLKEANPCSRTVCSHYDLDSREYMSQSDRPKPFAPRGALDGCVTDSTLAKEMTFWGRYGSSCGISFNKHEYCKNHIQYANYLEYLFDRPSQPWTKFTSHKFQNKRKNKTKRSKTKNSSRKTIKNKILLLEDSIFPADKDNVNTVLSEEKDTNTSNS